MLSAVDDDRAARERGEEGGGDGAVFEAAAEVLVSGAVPLV